MYETLTKPNFLELLWT